MLSRLGNRDPVGNRRRASHLAVTLRARESAPTALPPTDVLSGVPRKCGPRRLPRARNIVRAGRGNDGVADGLESPALRAVSFRIVHRTRVAETSAKSQRQQDEK